MPAYICGGLARQFVWRGTDDFLGSEWTRGRVLSIVLTVQISRLKHIRLESDGPPTRRAYASESDLSACGTHRQAGADQIKLAENQKEKK